MCVVFGFCGKNGDYADIQRALERTKSRGPDDSRIMNTGNGWLGFNRLSIMGINESGMHENIVSALDNQKYLSYNTNDVPGCPPGTDAFDVQ